MEEAEPQRFKVAKSTTWVLTHFEGKAELTIDSDRDKAYKSLQLYEFNSSEEDPN